MRALYVISSASLILLIALSVAGELFLAPIRPGGSWLVLKVLPLLAPLPGVLRARRYTYQWASLLILAYFVEGVVRAVSDVGPSRVVAAIELALSLVFFLSAIFLARVLSRGNG